MCYFTFRFRSHKVVTDICLTHLNHSYSDVPGDDALGCTRRWLASWPLNNEIFFTGDGNRNSGIALMKTYCSFSLAA